jgi:glutamate-1-semialdehyde 2,1-aminomutase
MREHGVFLPPAQFEAWFLSTAHTEADIRRTCRVVEESLRVAFASDGTGSSGAGTSHSSS